MSAKTYRLLLRLMSLAVAAFVAWSIVAENSVFVVVGAVVVALLLAGLLRRFTREIMADERTQRIDEKASAAAYRVFIKAAALTALGLILMRGSLPPSLTVAGETLAYAICVLMLVHLAFRHHYGRKL